MPAGTRWPSETKESADGQSGLNVRQLTRYKGHSHHFYFTNTGWYDGGKRLLFSSDRNNRTNLFGVELATGEITQLTDLEPVPPPREVEFLRASLNPITDEAYFLHGYDVMALDLNSLESRVIYEMPRGYDVSMLSCTAAAATVCLGIYEDFSDKFAVDLLRGYVGFREYFQAGPESRIIAARIDGGGAPVAWQERSWIGHVNTSPRRAGLLTFCHEGPWDLVDNRIWGLDLESGEVWRIRPRLHGETVGHEYWYVDGQRMGYHGKYADGRPFLGHCRFDDSAHVEVAFDSVTGHIHSNDERLIVGDGGSVIRLWRWNGSSYDGPRALCRHDSSMKIQQAHPHPRFTEDGRSVVFTTDRTGYCNVCLVDLPDFESLPAAED